MLNQRLSTTSPAHRPLITPFRVQDDEGGAWSSFQGVLVATGKRDTAVLQYLKSVALHNWLFGIEVAGTRALVDCIPLSLDEAFSRVYS